MGLSPSREAAIHAASQELPNILRKPKVYCRVQNSPPPASVLNHINPGHTTTYYLSSILILFSHLRVHIPSGLSFRFFHENTKSISSPPPPQTKDIYLAHLLLLDFIIVIRLGKSTSFTVPMYIQ